MQLELLWGFSLLIFCIFKLFLVVLDAMIDASNLTCPQASTWLLYRFMPCLFWFFNQYRRALRHRTCICLRLTLPWFASKAWSFFMKLLMSLYQLSEKLVICWLESPHWLRNASSLGSISAVSIGYCPSFCKFCWDLLCALYKPVGIKTKFPSLPPQFS